MFENSKWVKGQEVHLCNQNPVCCGLWECVYVLAIATVLLYVCVQYGWMGSVCIVHIIVPKVEAGEWPVVPKVELGEQRVKTQNFFHLLGTVINKPPSLWLWSWKLTQLHKMSYFMVWTLEVFSTSFTVHYLSISWVHGLTSEMWFGRWILHNLSHTCTSADNLYNIMLLVFTWQEQMAIATAYCGLRKLFPLIVIAIASKHILNHLW